MMERKYVKWLSLTIYLFLLCWMVDYKIGLLLHFKSLVIVLAGSLFLTLSRYKKGMEINEILEIGKWHSLITGMLLSFLMNVSTLSSIDSSQNNLLIVALNFRPLFYSMILYLILYNRTTKSEVLPLPQQLLITEESKLRLKLHYHLTQREYEIAILLLDQQTNAFIAENLFISEATAKKHISNIYKKCQVSSRDQLFLLTCQLNAIESTSDEKV